MPHSLSDTEKWHLERRREALERKRAGATFREVGEYLGVTKQRAKQMCDQAYEEERAAHIARTGKTDA